MTNANANNFTTTTAIWAGNYGHYAAGYLVGEWIDLPMNTNDLWATIRTACRVTPTCEEVGIFDTDFDFDGYQISEYDSIDSVNALAAAIRNADDYQLMAATAYMSLQCDLTALKAANIIVNADDIAFYPYADGTEMMSDDERLGYTLMEDSEALRQLEALGLDGYFDYEKYGRDAQISGDVDAFEDGYMIYSEVDDDTYTAAEILEMCGYCNDDQDTAA